MSEFHTSITIQAPAEHVWTVLADVQRWPEWTASVSSVEVLDKAPLSVGSRVRIHQPKLRPAVWTVTEWQPGQRFVWVSKNPGVVAVATHSLTPGPTGCTLTLILQYKGLLGGLVGFLGRGLTKTYLGLEAAGLKARSEG